MEGTAEEGKVVVVSREERDGAYGDYSCGNILLCKYPLHEVVRALFFKCFGFETSHQPAAVKETEPSTTEPVSSSADPGPTVTSGDMAMRFRPPPRRPVTRGSGPETNSTGSA
ncbi:hypothetical protein DCAR_0417908 [Daucus carota subsp. sativus]|uniref:Uncharacterized protein n=1 Tax=Daucus carota subsp. sativus TaxID=79200 RepID=A0A165Z0J5_DAUCS|nr:PREDICTED: uncharacterized protein LOC108218000 [Daucus carota subsp. sativus]WOG98564.1 hypothetical protein DCAR_0417908 [Daucus carota subsp. sativus]